jgi:hypothetical protein
MRCATGARTGAPMRCAKQVSSARQKGAHRALLLLNDTP